MIEEDIEKYILYLEAKRHVWQAMKFLNLTKDHLQQSHWKKSFEKQESLLLLNVPFATNNLQTYIVSSIWWNHYKRKQFLWRVSNSHKPQTVTKTLLFCSELLYVAELVLASLNSYRSSLCFVRFVISLKERFFWWKHEKLFCWSWLTKVNFALLKQTMGWWMELFYFTNRLSSEWLRLHVSISPSNMQMI